MADHKESAVCHKHNAEDGPSLLQNGNLVFQTHHVGWIIASFFTVVATVASFWLVNKHLQWYTKKREQRFIIRILFLVPVYAIISCLSYFFWNHSTPIILIRDAYESTVLTAFFYLLLVYISPDPDEQRRIFLKYGLSRVADQEAARTGEKPKTWVWPMGFIKWKPADGLYFLQLMKWGVLQYCVLRPLTTLAAVILDYMGLYCEESWGVGWGHIYIVIIVSLSVTIAMYCLIQLYVVVSEQLAPFRPLLKLFAIKAVVFLTFWQATFLSVLTMFGVVNDTKYMTAADINIGIGALLETFEMMLFAFLHIKAFSYKPYRPVHDPLSDEPAPTRTPRLRSLGHALDFRETFREIWQGCVYIVDKVRGREHKADSNAKHASHFETAFGRDRYARRGEQKPFMDESSRPSPQASRERQWLGAGSDYGYGIHREKSETLEVQIERELERRGYASHIPGRGHIGRIPEDETLTHHTAQRSWWKNIYHRMSQSGREATSENLDSLTNQPSQHRQSRRQPQARHVSKCSDMTQGLLYGAHPDIDDPPPTSFMRQPHGSGHIHENRSRQHGPSPQQSRNRPTAPLPNHSSRPPHHSTRFDRRNLTSPQPLAPLSPGAAPSVDSLFGRAFHAEHTYSTQSHTDTTLPRLGAALSTYDLGMAGERNGYQSHRAYEPPEAIRSHTGHIVDSPTDDDKVSHQSEESTFYDAASDFEETESPPLPSSPPPATQTNSGNISPSTDTRPSPLRRSSAQIWSPDDRPRYGHDSVPPTSRGPQMPTPSYHGHDARRSMGKNRHVTRDSREYNETSSTVAQPSYSGPVQPQSKFPTVRPIEPPSRRYIGPVDDEQTPPNALYDISRRS